ncbi:MAG TPA: response regulator [Thermoplasmata archaeon]|jgi:CheY-like chemotaxis protein|nr:response regulator [Thermoplasmata archaeon]
MSKVIMVVDDNSDVITTIKYGLEDSTKNYRIIGVESAKQCFNLLNQNQIPDLILLDIMMPEMNGWETYNKLKENDTWRKIPVVFLTARVDATAKKAGKFLGDDYIEKPFEVGDLKTRIEKLLKDKS